MSPSPDPAAAWELGTVSGPGERMLASAGVPLWPWSGPALVVVCAAIGVWAAVGGRARLRRALARGGVWLELRAPVGVGPDAAPALARALTGVLHRAPGGRVGRSVCLSLEWMSTHRRVRLGIWVPPVIGARAVTRAVTQAWPGTLVTVRPDWPTRALLRPPGPGLVEVSELTPPTWWTPLLDPTPGRHPRPATGATNTAPAVAAEPLRGVWSALAELTPPRPAAHPRRGRDAGPGPGGQRGCAQLVLTAQFPTGAAALPTRLASRRSPCGQGARVWWGRLAARGVEALLRALLTGAHELLTTLLSTHRRARAGRPTPAPRTDPSATAGSTAAAHPATADPAALAAAKAREAKRASTPLLHATLRIAVLTPLTPATTSSPARSTRHRTRRRHRGGHRGRSTTAGIVAGYDLVADCRLVAHTRTAHTSDAGAHPRSTARVGGVLGALAARRPGVGFAATAPEVAALFHPPTQPARHHLPRAHARDARPGPWTRPPTPPGHPRPGGRGSRARRGGGQR